MINETIFMVKQDYNLYQYLKHHSYWYKYLLRDRSSLSKMVEEMKVEYKLTTKDKIERVREKMDMVSTFLQVFS